jgi:hypothetical protein
MARRSKYNERMIMSSIAIPDSIYSWLEETSRKKGISKNSIVIASIMKSMDAEDIDKLIDNMETTIKSKQTNLQDVQKQQEAIYVDYFNKLISTYHERIISSIRNNSRNIAIETFTNIILNKLMDVLLEDSIEFDKKDLSNLIEKQLRIVYKV